MNENSIFFAVDKIEDKYIEEAAESTMEENSVQPIFITPTPKKIKKLIFAIAGIAACFVLIFGVGIAVGRNTGIEITQTLSPINTAATSTEATTTEAAETEPESTRQEDTELTDQYGNKYTLYDRPMPEELLKDFDYEQHYLAVASNNPDAGEFFDTLDIPEKETLKELFYRGVTLGKGFSDPNWLTVELRVGAPVARINNYLETGIKYDSFYNSLLGVFEEDVVKTALKKAETIICPISYNNEIWMVLTDGLSRDILVKHMEYRLVKFTDTELIFETILYKTEKATLNTEAYDPQHPEKYQTETVENIFVKTENGWRIRALYTTYGYIVAEAAATPAEPTPPNNWHNEGYIIPENWLPIMRNDEAFENLDSLFNEPQAGKSISEIIQNLVNRNIVAVDIFYGWGPSFTEEYKVEEPNFGVVNPHTGKTNLYAIKSDYFSSLEEIEIIMNKTYTADLAHERLYGQDGDRQIFIERDNKLFVDYNCMYIWSALPFEDDSYIEIITDDEEECFFNYHFILWDPFDYENNETEEWYPHHYIVTLRAAKENGEWRLCSFVFNNPNVDYARDSANFISLMEKIIDRAKTVEEITTKIKNLGKGHGHVIDEINVYKNSTDLENGAAPIEKGTIEYGMCVRVDYDGECWLEQAIV